MDEGHYYLAEFFLNGELQWRSLYANEEDAEKDLDLWWSDTPSSTSPFDESTIERVRIEKTRQWPELTVRCDRLEDAIVQWLRDNHTNVWSNVLASITSSSLSAVYEAAVRAAKARRLTILDHVETSLGPVCLVSSPYIMDKILWALFDTPGHSLWSNDIATATGESLPDVHHELEQFRRIGVVEILEERRTASDVILSVRLDPEQLAKPWVDLYTLDADRS